MSEKKQINPFDTQNTEDAAGKPVEKKKKRYNPWPEESGWDPEKASRTTRP